MPSRLLERYKNAGCGIQLKFFSAVRPCHASFITLTHDETSSLCQVERKITTVSQPSSADLLVSDTKTERKCLTKIRDLLLSVGINKEKQSPCAKT